MQYFIRIFFQIIYYICQISSLAVIESNNVFFRFCSNFKCLCFCRNAFITIYLNCCFLYSFLIRFSIHLLFRIQYFICAYLQISYRVAKIIPLGVIDVDHILPGSDCQCVFVYTVVVVTCNLYHFICTGDHIFEGLVFCYLLVMQHLIGILLQIVYSVT